MIEIALKNVTVRIGGKPILDNISATITDSCAIVGSSGSGKSTLARAILGLVPYSGEILHKGLRFALIPQDPATALHPMKKISTLFNEVCSRDAQWRLLTNMGFSDPEKILCIYPHQLSGGMKQRVLIALALGCRPDVLIADEPTTGLDTIVQRQIVELLATLQVPLLLITHDERIAARLCTQQLVLEEGRLQGCGECHASI